MDGIYGARPGSARGTGSTGSTGSTFGAFSPRNDPRGGPSGRRGGAAQWAGFGSARLDRVHGRPAARCGW